MSGPPVAPCARQLSDLGEAIRCAGHTHFTFIPLSSALSFSHPPRSPLPASPLLTPPPPPLSSSPPTPPPRFFPPLSPARPSPPIPLLYPPHPLPSLPSFLPSPIIPPLPLPSPPPSPHPSPPPPPHSPPPPPRPRAACLVAGEPTREFTERQNGPPQFADAGDGKAAGPTADRARRHFRLWYGVSLLGRRLCSR